MCEQVKVDRTLTTGCICYSLAGSYCGKFGHTVHTNVSLHVFLNQSYLFAVFKNPDFAIVLSPSFPTLL